MIMAAKKPKIRLVADAEAMSKAAADILVEHISKSLQTRDVYSIALSGGSTPRRLYALLAGDPGLRGQIPWDRIHFFWGDERRVPPDHPESNYRMAFDAMLSRVSIPPANIHRMRAENPDADKAAGEYAQEIQQFFDIDAGEMPCFNCVLLGMGADGHFASLFPDSPDLATGLDPDSEQYCIPVDTAASAHPRVSLTLAALCCSEEILLLVFGEEKWRTLESARQTSDGYPVSSLLAQTRTPVRVFWAP